MNAVGVGNCFLLSYTYFIKKGNITRQYGPILSLLFFILGAIILNTIFNFSGYSQLFYGFEPVTNALGFAIAPLLLLYLRSLNKPSRPVTLRSGHLVHFYSYLLVVAISLWIPHSDLGKLGLMLIKSPWIIVLWNIHFFCYLIAIAFEFRKGRGSRSRTTISIVWGTVSIWVFNLLFYLYRLWVAPLPNLVYLNITLLFSVMTLYLFYKKLREGEANRRKANGKGLKKVPLHHIGNDPIVTAILRHKYYRNPDLDIRTLSQQLQIPYHELSGWINHSYGQNFNAFINSFRIREVAIALQKQEHLSYTIMGLAQRAGFKSASSFYAAFKKEKGITPTSFLQATTQIP